MSVMHIWCSVCIGLAPEGNEINIKCFYGWLNNWFGREKELFFFAIIGVSFLLSRGGCTQRTQDEELCELPGRWEKYAKHSLSIKLAIHLVYYYSKVLLEPHDFFANGDHLMCRTNAQRTRGPHTNALLERAHFEWQNCCVWAEQSLCQSPVNCGGIFSSSWKKGVHFCHFRTTPSCSRHISRTISSNRFPTPFEPMHFANKKFCNLQKNACSWLNEPPWCISTTFFKSKCKSLSIMRCVWERSSRDLKLLKSLLFPLSKWWQTIVEYRYSTTIFHRRRHEFCWVHTEQDVAPSLSNWSLH